MWREAALRPPPSSTATRAAGAVATRATAATPHPDRRAVRSRATATTTTNITSTSCSSSRRPAVPITYHCRTASTDRIATCRSGAAISNRRSPDRTRNRRPTRRCGMCPSRSRRAAVASPVPATVSPRSRPPPPHTRPAACQCPPPHRPASPSRMP